MDIKNGFRVHTANGLTIGIGRKGMKTGAIPTFYIGRGSQYGNPFHIGPDGDRIAVIERFQRETLPTLDLTPLRLALLNYGKIALLCYCAPLPCHGDAIAAALLY